MKRFVKLTEKEKKEKLNNCRRIVESITCECSVKEQYSQEYDYGNESDYFVRYGMGINKVLIIHE